MLPVFFIFLREGIEAALIVAILLAYLDRVARRDLFGHVLAGVGLAIALATAGGVAAYLTIRTYAGSRTQTIFETVTFLLAAAVLTYMTVWMRSHAATISQELRDKVAVAMDGRARFALSFLAFQAVGREGIETAVFTLAILFAQPTHFALAGGAAGLVVALAIAIAIFRLGKRLDLGKFFGIVGAVLVVFAAGLLADAVENMQQLGWLDFLAHPVWSTAGILAEGSTAGDVVHSLLGYAQRPTVLQVLVYGLYLVGAIALFLRSRPARVAVHAVAAPRPPGASSPTDR
ncbi:MAG: FTR1 family protein [Actinomycetota bacterium]|nr:FTR1 family protein [Actinomycetota bacterium]